MADVCVNLQRWWKEQQSDSLYVLFRLALAYILAILRCTRRRLIGKKERGYVWGKRPGTTGCVFFSRCQDWPTQHRKPIAHALLNSLLSVAWASGAMQEVVGTVISTLRWGSHVCKLPVEREQQSRLYTPGCPGGYPRVTCLLLLYFISPYFFLSQQAKYPWISLIHCQLTCDTFYNIF